MSPPSSGGIPLVRKDWSARALQAGKLPRKGGRCDGALDGNADEDQLAMAGHRPRGLPDSRGCGLQLGFELKQQPVGYLHDGHHRRAVDHLKHAQRVEPGDRDVRGRGD
jgi:hypothetical protein